MSSNQSRSFCTSAENGCSTKIQLHEVKYVWIIENFNFHEAIGTDLQSTTFSAVTKPQVKWYLEIGPNGETDTKDAVSFHVFLASDSVPNKIFAKFCASVLNSQQKEVCRTGAIADAAIDEYCVVSGDTSCSNWGLNEFLIKNDKFRNTLLVNQKLTIVCTIVFSSASDAFRTNNIGDHTPLYSEFPECNLVENFGMLLENQEFSDIVLSVKGKEYSAHKAILAARSSVFAAMFKYDFTENETNRIEIEDMNEETGFEMLRYIYTGKCTNTENLADKLLAAADKYDLGRLKMICAEALYKKLSVDNALNILVLADLHSVAELKSATVKFIVSKFAEVVASTAWKNILVSCPDLIDEVCQNVAVRPTMLGKRKNEGTNSECKRNRIE